MTRFKGDSFLKLIELADEYQNTFILKYDLNSDSFMIKIISLDPAEEFSMDCVTSIEIFIKIYREQVKKELIRSGRLN